MRTHWLVCLVAVLGCKKEPAAPGVEAPAAPASTAEQDALWQLAPDGAQIGVVGSPRGLAMIERGAIAIDAMLAGAPELAALHHRIEQAWTRVIGAPKPSLAELGLTAAKGFAVFVTEQGRTAMVIPVADRDKFVARLHGRKESDHDAFDHSPFDQDPAYQDPVHEELRKDPQSSQLYEQLTGEPLDHPTACKPVRGAYVCVDQPELFDKLGHGNLAATRAQAGARGDLEFVGQGFSGAPNLTVAAVVQLAPGTVTVRGTVGGVPADVTRVLGNPVRPRAGSATAAGFGVIDVSPFVTALPPVPIAPGVTAAQLGRSLAGPIQFAIPPGSHDLATLDLALRILLNDPAPAKALVEHCADIAGLEPLGASFKNGACHMSVPNLNTEIDAWVDGNELRLGRRAGVRPAAIEPSSLSTELAQGVWSVAIFGRGSYLALASLPAMTAALSQLPPEMSVMPRFLPLFNEFGVGLRKDGDALHFVLGLRTLWANPRDVVDKVLAISQAQIASGQATATATAIAASAPRSPFAQDLGAGAGGMVAVMAPLGILAGIAVPSFMDYMKRSKRTEASLQLNKIGKNAKRAYVETSQFPKGRAALTPPTTCCGQGPPPNHCVTSPDDWRKNPVWAALDFEIDEPSLFRYSYESDGKTFTAKAVGDLDCDGVEITYELNGEVKGGQPAYWLTEPPVGAD